MALDDPRLEWIRDRVYCAFGISDPNCFEELLNQNDGEQEARLLKFFNESSAEEGASTLLFFKGVREEEVEVEIAIEPEEILKLGYVPQDDHVMNTLEIEDLDKELVDTNIPPDDQKDQEKTTDIAPQNEDFDVKSTVASDMLVPAENGGITGSLQEESTGEDPPSFPLTKIIKQTVYRTFLLVSFNCIPEEFANSSTLYFLRNTQETISEPNDIQEANDVMPMFLEYGILNGHSLLMLKQVFSQVFMPLLSYNQHKNGDNSIQLDQQQQKGTDEEPNENDANKPEEPSQELRSVQLIRDELLMNMQKFLNHIQQTIQQLEGEIKLEMPQMNLDIEAEILATDFKVVEKLEQCIMKWQTQMSEALEEQLKKKPQGNGPLAEIDFWRERNATLSALSEQLKLPSVKKVLNVLSIAEPSLVQNLDLTVTEIAKYHVEAADNVRFLSTLERHFKNLTHGTGFNVVLDTIPPMMNALRMVWIISRHYNKDERMVQLMERIAWEIAERVCRVLNIRSLFRENKETAKSKALEAKRTLKLWKSCYLEVRAKIEASGRDQRWEFDRKRLFEKTDYLSGICQDLFNVLQVLEEFYNIFGPELKAVTGDPKRIDEVLHRVDGLIEPMEIMTFDPFNVKYAQQWKIIMEDFKHEVLAIEGEAVNFIDESFKTLRSAEAAFDMLLKFKHIRSRDAINKQMMMKFNDILEQYCKEIDIVNNLFTQNQENPPLYKDHPPVAGSIYWERSLFYRIKQTIIRFLEMEEMLSSDRGKAAKSKYLEVARRMKEYEDSKYEAWKEMTVQTLPLLLKRSLLVNMHTSGVNIQPNTSASDLVTN